MHDVTLAQGKLKQKSRFKATLWPGLLQHCLKKKGRATFPKVQPLERAFVLYKSMCLYYKHPVYLSSRNVFSHSSELSAF